MSTGKPPHYQGHRVRLRERLMRDSTTLADYELLELILGLALLRCDTKPLAKELLQRFETLRGVMDAYPEELAAVPGFGPGLVTHWKLLREFMARYVESPARTRETLSDPKQVAAMARMRLAGCPHEEIWAALLSTTNRLLAWERVDVGTVNASMVYPRDLLELALRHKATGIILVHNHPGGTLGPSGGDLELTRNLQRSAAAMGIRLLDHLVVTDSACFSFKDDGLL